MDDPEWRTVAGAQCSFWDLWFCVCAWPIESGRYDSGWATRRLAVDGMVEAATKRRGPDTAVRVLDAAAAAGVSPEWVRSRRAEIAAMQP